MIKLNQHMKDSKPDYNEILDAEPFIIAINTELLDKDIDKIKKSIPLAKGKHNIKNLNGLLDYLQKTRKKIKGNELEIGWVISKDKLNTYPINLKVIDEYKIDATDYIELHDSKLVRLDFSKIIDIMSFEFVHRDFGYEHQDIEDVLEKCGISGTVSTDVMIKFFENENIKPYELSRGAKMEDSPYIDEVDKTIKNYFYSEVFDVKTINNMYQPVIESSAKIAMDMIASDIYKTCCKNGLNVKLVSIGETSITLMHEEDTNIDIDELFKGSTMRIFGRNFEVKPDVKIF